MRKYRPPAGAGETMGRDGVLASEIKVTKIPIGRSKNRDSWMPAKFAFGIRNKNLLSR